MLFNKGILNNYDHKCGLPITSDLESHRFSKNKVFILWLLNGWLLNGQLLNSWLLNWRLLNGQLKQSFLEKK